MNATSPTVHHTTTSDEMGLRDLLSRLRKSRRAQSKARSEDPTEASGLVVPRPTESTPDLGIGPSTLPTSNPLVSHDQEASNSKQTTSFLTLHLTLFHPTQTTSFPTLHNLSPERAIIRNPGIVPPSWALPQTRTSLNRVGNPLRAPRPRWSSTW